jgi:hypothetical protein
MVAVPEGHPIGGVVMVATREIADGDEVLFDYQLGPPFPEWFAPRNELADVANEAQGRWC